MNRKPAPTLRPGDRQAGMALVLSLLFLLILTILGVTSMNTSTLQEKMAGNMKNQYTAFQASESALRDGESWLQQQTSRPPPTSDGSSGVWNLGTPGDFLDPTHDFSWWQANGEEYGPDGAQDIASASDDPRYVIEERAFANDSVNLGLSYGISGRYYYRVTGFGVGSTRAAQVLTQSSYPRRYQ